MEPQINTDEHRSKKKNAKQLDYVNKFHPFASSLLWLFVFSHLCLSVFICGFKFRAFVPLT